jgi:alpha-glucosidase
MTSSVGQAFRLPPLFCAGLLLSTGIGGAQDLRFVASPDGRVTFRVFIAPPHPGEPDRLAYQVLYKGKPLLDTSFVAFEIREQAPLGEKLGLMTSSESGGNGYRALAAEYMQNGTTGRRLNLEARAYDQGVAFRYVIPRSSPLEEIFIQNEDTEFRFAGDPDVFPALLADFDGTAKPPSRIRLSQIPADSLIAAPLVAEQPGVGWISISQAGGSGYPRLFLTRAEGTTLLTALPPLPNDPKLALDTTTPLVCPWRVVLVGPTRESVTDSAILAGLVEKALVQKH